MKFGIGSFHDDLLGLKMRFWGLERTLNFSPLSLPNFGACGDRYNLARCLGCFLFQHVVVDRICKKI